MLVIASSIVCATFNYLLLLILLSLALDVLLIQRCLSRLFHSKRNDGSILLTLKGGLTTETKEKLLSVLQEKVTGGKLQSLSFSDSITTIHFSFSGLHTNQLDGLASSLKQVALVQKLNIFFNR